MRGFGYLAMEHILFYMHIFLDMRSEEKLVIHAQLLLTSIDCWGVLEEGIMKRFVLQRPKQDPIP